MTPPSLRWWLLPWFLFAVTAPLWLQWSEPETFKAINAACWPVAAVIWTGLSLLGNGWGLLGVTAPLLVLAPRLMWGWLCAAPFAVLFARTGKFFIESPRPAAVIDNTQMRIVGEVLEKVSMPSGHTLTAFAVASGIYFAIEAPRRGRYLWLFALAAGAGLSRIAVGAHWPGDVAVGAALGLLSGMLGHHLLRRLSARWMDPAGWPLRLVAGLVAVSVYPLVFDELDFADNQPLQWVLAAVVTLSLLVFLRQTFRDKSASSPR